VIYFNLFFETFKDLHMKAFSVEPGP